MKLQVSASHKLIGLIVVVGLALSACQTTGTQALNVQDAQALSVNAVRIDTSVLQQKGWGSSYPSIIKTAMSREIQQDLGARLGRQGRGGVTIVVNVKSVTLSSYAGGDGISFAGSSSNDYMESETLLLGESGRVIARYPVLSVLGADSGGAWYRPDNEQRRVAALSEHHGAWVVRTIFGR
jgi:hypothetical protein